MQLYTIESLSGFTSENLEIKDLERVLDTNLNDVVNIANLQVGEKLNRPFRIKHDGEVVTGLYETKNSKFYLYVIRTT